MSGAEIPRPLAECVGFCPQDQSLDLGFKPQALLDLCGR